MSKEIKKHFSKTVGDYDTVADKVVFKNNELHDELVKSIPFKKDEKIHVLDLGCGTGHGMKLISDLFPNSTLVGIDFSSLMIAKSRDKLKPLINRP